VEGVLHLEVVFVGAAVPLQKLGEASIHAVGLEQHQVLMEDIDHKEGYQYKVRNRIDYLVFHHRIADRLGGSWKQKNRKKLPSLLLINGRTKTRKQTSNHWALSVILEHSPKVTESCLVGEDHQSTVEGEPCVVLQALLVCNVFDQFLKVAEIK
jgi:hypothetical protein